MRAERKAGDLLQKMRREQGKRTDLTSRNDCRKSEYRAALESSGISERTGQRWQELANVPKEQFEAALREPEPGTTIGIIRAVNDSPRI